MNSRSVLTIGLILVVIGILAFVNIYGVEIGNVKLNAVTQDIKLGLDIEGGVVVVYEAVTDLKGEELTKLMTETKSVISNRINILGLTEPNVFVQGDNRIRIELPGVEDATDALKTVGKTALLEFYLVDEGKSATDGETIDRTIGELVLTGKNVKDSGLTTDRYGKPAVSLQLDSEGADLFRVATQKASEYYGQIAIVLDDLIISAPHSDTTIAGGEASISGNFSLEEANELASLIRGGALPTELREIQTSAIGPTLGIDALKSSLNAAKIGFILVVAFMVIYYRIPGVIASLALVLYASIILMLMVFFNATLTLPGVAGIVLSVGMAVDANVIIFERLKEELRNGKTLRASVESGFSKALRTIMDSNITTLIAAIVLFNFGEGPIQGFAVTLMLGIFTSMFTAIIITKTLLKNIVSSNLVSNTKLFGA